MFGQLNIASKIFVFRKRFCVKRNVKQLEVGGKFGQKIFWVKKKLAAENFESQKILLPK